MVTKKNITLLLISIVLMSNTIVSTKSYTDTQEYALKAAFIYRFIDYIEWDKNSNSKTFEIAVLKKSPITEMLIEISKDKKVKNKNMYVREYYDLNDIGFCNILFISKNYNDPIETVISKFSDKNVLIITEQIGYGEKGSHINFLISENKLKFEVNLNAAKKARLKLSSQLLEHAIIISP
jgi:hypothetical protein